jgi:hypothetical protein
MAAASARAVAREQAAVAQEVARQDSRGGECSYGTCMGGAGTVSYSPWTPAAGGSCSAALTQTRSWFCSPEQNTGTQACTAACTDSEGNSAPASFCGAAPPVQSCTPSSAVCPAPSTALLAQTVQDQGTCSFAWAVTLSGACVGGSGDWQYTAWTPAFGCGPTTQTRSATCAPYPSSGSQSQSATCLASDHVAVADGYCTQQKPAPTAPCTPDPTVCGAQGPTTQSADLINQCGTVGECVADVANGVFCVSVPLN